MLLGEGGGKRNNEGGKIDIAPNREFLQGKKALESEN